MFPPDGIQLRDNSLVLWSCGGKNFVEFTIRGNRETAMAGIFKVLEEFPHIAFSFDMNGPDFGLGDMPRLGVSLF